VEHADAVGRNTVRQQISGEGPAHSHHAASRAERPAIELIVDGHLEVRIGVAVLKGEPRPLAIQSRKLEQKMRFDVMRLEDVWVD